MGDHLLKLLEVPNIHLYPRISGPLLDQLSHDQVAYLDLAANKEDQATQKASDLDKPILTFSSTADQRDFNNYHVFADDDVMGMADYIRNLVNHEE